jgi:transcriptional antiterminator RfaH
MPILDFETFIYPESLLDDSITTEPIVERQWWAIYTKPRQEKSLARDLLAYRVPFFLPLVRKRSIYRGRRIQSYLPLFAGYLFLFGSDEDRLRAIATNRISQLLIVHDSSTLVDDLRSIHRLIQLGVPLGVETRLKPGGRVRVTSGPFMGLEGTIEACKSGYRLIVGVNLLQRGVSLELDDASVDPIY